ncbi:MAG: hypothetical protein FLDDKLPJ_01704 [Phycisphaerae bacterium]|nr:hypothetical protein [Phycisphaerae bacterium]
MRKLVGLFAALALSAGYAFADCSGNEAITAKCRNGKVKVKLTGGTAGDTATFQLDGDESTNISVTVGDDGKAKAKWKGVADGAHTVSYLECGQSADVEC